MRAKELNASSGTLARGFLDQDGAHSECRAIASTFTHNHVTGANPRAPFRIKPLAY